MTKLEDNHARLSDLTQGEHMLLWAFRAAAFGVGTADWSGASSRRLADPWGSRR